MNTLCGKKVLKGKDADDAQNAHVEEGVKIEPITVGMRQTITMLIVGLRLTPFYRAGAR